MPTLQELAAEAICSALYRMPFSEFLGERPDPVTKNDTQWFRLTRDTGVAVRDMTDEQRAKQVLVNVVPEDRLGGLVSVRVWWLNYSGDIRLTGRQTFQIPTLAVTQAKTQEATTEVVVRVLEIFDDVLRGVGVAGPIDQVAPASNASDPDDPDDMAVPGE